MADKLTFNDVDIDDLSASELRDIVREMAPTFLQIQKQTQDALSAEQKRLDQANIRLVAAQAAFDDVKKLKSK